MFIHNKISNHKTLDVVLVLYFTLSSNGIVITCRSQWDATSNTIAEKIANGNAYYKNLQAIIVVDDNVGCVDNKDQNCFRPSFPYPSV